MNSAIIKSADFHLVSEFVQADAKKRLCLGAALGAAGAFNVYRNGLGQLILDPVKAVPESEAWLHENPKDLASVRRGMQQSARGQVRDRGDFTKYTQE